MAGKKGTGLGNKNAVGHSDGKRYPNRSLEQFWSKLDNTSLPAALDYCTDMLEQLKKDPIKIEDKEWRNAGLKAAQILFSKAPERIANPDGSNIKAPVIYLPKRQVDND